MCLRQFHCNTEDETFAILRLLLLLSNSGLSFYMCVCVCVCVTDLFSLFASDLGGYAAREDIEAVLQILDGETPASLQKCFIEVSQLDALSSGSFM